jgi:hypothetical protein
LRFPSLLPHQKLQSIELIAKHKPLGNLKQDMEKVGIACATDFINTSFPPDARVFSSHPWTLFHIQSFRYLNAPLVDLPTSEGIPRYFSLSVSLDTIEYSFHRMPTRLWASLAEED